MIFRNDPQLRVIPDTNTWLDAAFRTDSVARRAIDYLQTHSTPILVEEIIKDEALKILRRRRIELGLSFDPRKHFEAFTAGFLHVPPSDLVKVKVNKADMPVARAAIHYKAMILTQDAPLIAECLADGISAAFPWSLLTASDGEPPIEEILRIVPLSKSTGTIFARVTPGGWLGMAGVGAFTVIDIENIGRLWFDSGSEEWVYDGACQVRMGFPPAGQAQSLICVTYKFPSSGSGTIILRAFSPQLGKHETKPCNTLKRPKKDGGQIRIGSSLTGQDFWNGAIRHLTTSSDGMSAAKWKPLCQIPNAAPNPLNSGSLNHSLLMMNDWFI